MKLKAMFKAYQSALEQSSLCLKVQHLLLEVDCVGSCEVQTYC